MKNRFHRLKEIFSSKIKPKMKNKKVFWGSIAGCTGLAIILAGGFFLQAKGASKNQTETTVQSAEAKTGTISTTVEGTGSVSNGAATDVVVPTGIKVKEVLVESGDTVEEGQVLATLDEASIASELLEVKENIESVEDEIDDLSSDAQTEGTTEYLQAKVLNGELTELQEAETTLTGLLETQTITATCAGTVSSVNVEADTEITKSSGSSSSGSSTSGSSSGSSSSGSSSSAAATGMSTAGSSTSESSDSSETTTSSDSTSSTNTSASGTYSLMFLSASTSGTSASSAESTTDTTEAQSQSTDSKAVYVSTESDTTETSDSEKITSVDVKVTAPKTGEKPQTTITETDQYIGTISWNCSTDTFEAGTSYTADIRLTAKDGYVFSARILPEISGADITSEVLENDAGQSVLRIKAKFTKTSAKDSNNNGSNNNGSSNDTGSSTGNNGNSSNGNTSNSGTASGAISSGGASSGSTSGVNESGATATGGTASGSSESGSSDSGSAAGSSDSSDSVSTDGSSTSAQYSAYETAAFSIASDEKATVSINVDELDITSVKEGQTAKITLDAIDGEEFEGTITSVSSEASSGSSSAKYPVEITFDKTDDMRIGMTASASISIDEAEDAVLIPVDALQEKGNKTFVYTEKDSDGNLSGEVEVETGLSNGNKVEITSGLKSGDTVYYLKTTSSGSSDSQQNMQDMGGGPGGNGEAPSGDMGGNGGGPGGNGGEAPSGGPGGSSSN